MLVHLRHLGMQRTVQRLASVDLCKIISELHSVVEQGVGGNFTSIIRAVKTQGLARFSFSVSSGHCTINRTMISITGHIRGIPVEGVPGNQARFQQMNPLSLHRRDIR